MTASKDRLRWADMPSHAQAIVNDLAAGTVVAAQNCPGGYSPGLASRLRLADQKRIFVKAIDAQTWPHEAVTYRDEARSAAALSDTAPAAQLLNSYDDGRWVVLVFEDIDGRPPRQPWSSRELERVITALHLGQPCEPLPRDHPRLGGWSSLLDSDRLAEFSPWAAANLERLIDLERDGLSAARGESLVHFDMYAHNILLTPERVVFVDWPHARLGNPDVDLVMLLSSVAADGVDPEPYAHGVQGLDAILAAHAGFLVSGGLSEPSPGLMPVLAAKRKLGRGAVDWLRQRLDS
jgi:Ser/Thr protein kinase RdoA (MazF antagonist)